MTSPWRVLALAAFAVLAPAAAFADTPKISDLVDELRRIQFKVAQGDKAAYPAQLNQLKTIGAAIATASPETWKNKREADSLVIYILSGGSLADVGPLLKGDAIIEFGAIARARRARLCHQSRGRRHRSARRKRI